MKSSAAPMRMVSCLLALALGACASEASQPAHPSGDGGPPHASPSSHHGPHGHHGHGEHHAGMSHDFSDAERWAERFDAADRDAWQKPDEVVKLLALTEGMVVVDLGAGTGYFESRLSKAVGARGKVFALDVEKNMVAFMEKRFASESLANVEARTCPSDGTGLAESSVDRVLIVDTWHHLGDRPAYAKHLASVLRPGGSVMVVDFTLETEKGPPKEHRIAPEAAIAELAAAGLTGAVLEETLPDQYVVSARKP